MQGRLRTRCVGKSELPRFVSTSINTCAVVLALVLKLALVPEPDVEVVTAVLNGVAEFTPEYPNAARYYSRQGPGRDERNCLCPARWIYEVPQFRAGAGIRRSCRGRKEIEGIAVRPTFGAFSANNRLGSNLRITIRARGVGTAHGGRTYNCT